MNTKFWKFCYPLVLQIIILIFPREKFAVAETTYLDPANLYLVAIDPNITYYGIALQIQPARFVHFRVDDFFKVFPTIIIGDRRKKHELVAKSAGQYNQNNKKNKNFVPAEIWWFIDMQDSLRLANLTTELDALNEVNSYYSDTVTTLYLYFTRPYTNISLAEAVINQANYIQNAISETLSRNLSIAVEIQDQNITCNDLLLLPLPSLRSITVWVYNDDSVDGSFSDIENSVDSITECQKLLDKTSETKLIIKGANGNGQNETHTGFSIDYRNSGFKITCVSGKNITSFDSCMSLKLLNNFANNVASYFAIYDVKVDNALGISEHPNSLFCGVHKNETVSWSKSIVSLHKDVGFSTYFDSRRLSYNPVILRELIIASPILLIENRYELTNLSEVQLNDFLDAYAEAYTIYKNEAKENFRHRFIKIKLDIRPIDSRDKNFISKWTTIAIQAATRVNKLHPELVDGLVHHLEKENVTVLTYILDAFKQVKRSQNWKQGIKLGISLPIHLYTMCRYFRFGPGAMDIMVFEYKLQLSIQCLSKTRDRLFEEQGDYYTPYLNCRTSIATRNFRTMLLARVTKCKPKWQSTVETNVQYALTVERLNELISAYGNSMYIGNAFQEEDDSCGWWTIEENKTGNNEIFIEDRKSYLRRIWHRPNENKLNSPNLLWIWIVLPLLFVCLMFAAISVVVILRFKQMYLPRYAEVSAFFEGDTNVHHDDTVSSGNADALASKYNKEKFEISSSDYSIDHEKCLGMGEFGSVFYATVTKDKQNVSVAVKTTKRHTERPQHEDLVGLRGLISETKILSYVGEHPNIIQLIGAYTEKLKQGYLAVFLELCSNGSLLKHLRETKSKLQKSHNSNVYTNDLSPNQACAEELKSNLVRWSYEISRGMEFLSDKHIVHADLATRNVLLDSDFVAKIADFGLSRRMYNYTNYVKTHQEPLPWRWMAPEALQSLTFDESTDVWAYGVTLWEIFSLGDLPYPGLSWDINFTNQLHRGLRPAEPNYNQEEMYSVMLYCWNNDPQKRPTFAKIKNMIEGKLDTLVQSSKTNSYANVS